MVKVRGLFKKQKLRKHYDEALIRSIEEMKADWAHQEQLEKLSYGVNEELQAEVKIAKAKYFLLLSEAKQRKVTLKR